MLVQQPVKHQEISHPNTAGSKSDENRMTGYSSARNKEKWKVYTRCQIPLLVIFWQGASLDSAVSFTIPLSKQSTILVSYGNRM